MRRTSEDIPHSAPPLRPIGLSRWAWRQLTSMRVAVVLLLLLTLAAIPGSILPQRGLDPAGVAMLRADSPRLAAWYERLGLFDVYAAPWFAAIYLLLFVSLVGCILPRTRQHWRAVRRPPPSLFAADVTVRESPSASPRQATIQVNHPLDIDGTLIHALNPGYALTLAVTNRRGETIFAEAVPFLPQDPDFASTGVAKIPRPGPDVGIEGALMPTAVLDGKNGPRSVSPRLDNPVFVPDRLDRRSRHRRRHPSISVQAGYHGHAPGADGAWHALAGGPARGPRRDTPSGVTIRLVAVRPWVNLQVSRSVGKHWVLAGTLLATAGLVASLSGRRRRIWIRVTAVDSEMSRVELGGLDSSAGGDVTVELEQLHELFTAPFPVHTMAGGSR